MSVPPVDASAALLRPHWHAGPGEPDEPVPIGDPEDDDGVAEDDDDDDDDDDDEGDTVWTGGARAAARACSAAGIVRRIR